MLIKGTLSSQFAPLRDSFACRPTPPVGHALKEHCRRNYRASRPSIFGLGMIEELARDGYSLSLGTMYSLLHGLENKGGIRVGSPSICRPQQWGARSRGEENRLSTIANFASFRTRTLVSVPFPKQFRSAGSSSPEH